MTDPVTIADIYKLFQRSQAEADRRFAEADRRAADADRRAADASARFERELAESRAEFDRRMAESKAVDEQRAAEAEARLARAEEIAAQANRAVSSLTSRWGQFVENLVAPGVVQMFQAKGIDVKEVHSRMKAKRGAIAMEIDVFAVDDTEAVAVEVKSRLTQTAVSDFIQTLQQFKVAFPVYRDYHIYGAVAGIEIDKGADRYAYKQGLFVIRQSGDAVQIDNDEAFEPRVW